MDKSPEFVVNISCQKLEKYNFDLCRSSQKGTEDYSTNDYEISQKNSTLTYLSSDSDDKNKSSKPQNFCSLFSLFLALVACISGSYIMWATDLFTRILHQNIVLSNNSMRYEAWKNPPVQAFFKVYIFNYTNIYEFESGIDTKLKIQELGPYTYIERWQRIDVRFNRNGTATYRDKKTYIFSPEHSNGKESDVVVVPNIPFLSAMALSKQANRFLRWSFLQFLNSMGAKPFLSLTVNKFLWGYEDRLSVLAQKILSFQYGLPISKFGLLTMRNETLGDYVTIYTGEEDSSKIGIVANYDGKTSLNYWHSQECNRIDGTDGTLYPPSIVYPNSTLYVYSKDLCRKIPLVYKKQYVDQHGISVMRFHLPENVFASGHEKKENLCYCNQFINDITCLPSGIFNLGPCAFEAPVVTSLPHFLYGDPILTKGYEGLNPAKSRHETYVEVDPKLGIPIGGKSRLQLNILTGGTHSSPWNRKYKDQFVFPITWIDYGLDRLPDDLCFKIKSLLSLIQITQFSLSYGFLLCTAVFAILFLKSCSQNLYLKNFQNEIFKRFMRKSEISLYSVPEKR